jgi:DNA-binding transcriptional LysR family regulator
MATVNFEWLEVLRAVAEMKSFSRAAQRLGRDKSLVSRAIRALEAQLGTQLLVRTTRSVRPTPEGEALLSRVAPALQELHDAVSSVPDRAHLPSGEVVITTTPDLGQAYLARALVGFRQRHPAVRVRVVLSQGLLDLMADEVDLALRVGRPGGENLVARKLGELSAGFYASPTYLERRGTPQRLEQLGAHEGLWPIPLRGQQAFSPGARPVPPVVSCSDFSLLAEVARAGGGVALLPTYLAARHVAMGALVRVLPGVSLGGAPLFLVSRPARPVPPRVAALRSYLLEQGFEGR